MHWAHLTSKMYRISQYLRKIRDQSIMSEEHCKSEDRVFLSELNGLCITRATGSTEKHAQTHYRLRRAGGRSGFDRLLAMLRVFVPACLHGRVC